VVELDVERTINLLVQTGILIGLITGAGIWVKRWVRKTVSEPIQHQVSPNGNGNRDTTRHIIESIQIGQDEMISRMDHQDQVGDRNFKLAQQALETSGEALGIARHTAGRLDDHMRGHQ
jgi:hypothetical protein